MRSCFLPRVNTPGNQTLRSQWIWPIRVTQSRAPAKSIMKTTAEGEPRPYGESQSRHRNFLLTVTMTVGKTKSVFIASCQGTCTGVTGVRSLESHDVFALSLISDWWETQFRCSPQNAEGQLLGGISETPLTVIKQIGEGIVNLNSPLAVALHC